MNNGWLIPGWVCTRSACGLFNGEVSGVRKVCRGCSHPRPEREPLSADQKVTLESKGLLVGDGDGGLKG